MNLYTVHIEKDGMRLFAPIELDSDDQAMAIAEEHPETVEVHRLDNTLGDFVRIWPIETH
ncbi:MAG: hypothetical protein H6961_11115 [Chromatiaceae bacterium]|nr:hypothetical protein [Chromatiaceae bacterium]